MKKDSGNLATRMKRYELVNRRFSVKGVPIVIRCDGRAFHTFTKGMEYPFSEVMQNTTVKSAIYAASKLQGFKFGYTQSDEITFVLSDTDSINTETCRGGNFDKIMTDVAVDCSNQFNHFEGIPEHRENHNQGFANFDAKVFNIPAHDLINNLVWRAQDWNRKSLQMFSRKYFTQSELYKKNREAMHEMLHKIDKNWAKDVKPQFRNGTFFINTPTGIITQCNVIPTYQSIIDCVKVCTGFETIGITT